MYKRIRPKSLETSVGVCFKNRSSYIEDKIVSFTDIKDGKVRDCTVKLPKHFENPHIKVGKLVIYNSYCLCKPPFKQHFCLKMKCLYLHPSSYTIMYGIYIYSCSCTYYVVFVLLYYFVFFKNTYIVNTFLL